MEILDTPAILSKRCLCNILQVMKTILLIWILGLLRLSSSALPNDHRNSSEYQREILRELGRVLNFPSEEKFLSREGQPFTINVEGIVGAGKSTLLRYISEYPYFDILPEPVSKWTNLNGSDLLGLVFENPSRWAMVQESYVLLTLVEEHLRPYGVVKMMERSAHSARYCFTEQFYQVGQMSKTEYDVLDAWFNFLNSEMNLKTDLTIYLRVKPEKVYARIVERGRQEEKKLTFKFLQNLHRLHEDWLFYKNTTWSRPSEKVLIIDAGDSLETMSDLYRAIGQKLWSSIPKRIKLHNNEDLTSEDRKNSTNS